MAAIFFVSSLSDPPLPGGASDKSAHLIAYTVLGLTAVRAVAGGLPRRITVRMAAMAIAITVGHGMSDEFHQRFVPGRSADLADLAADATGALLATIGCWAWGIISTRPEACRGHDDL
ncbi:MAG TPA: VanZ family protein [Vicinamibacterales bacterium]